MLSAYMLCLMLLFINLKYVARLKNYISTFHMVNHLNNNVLLLMV
jgi:hypothetical protein